MIQKITLLMNLSYHYLPECQRLFFSFLKKRKEARRRPASRFFSLLEKRIKKASGKKNIFSIKELFQKEVMIYQYSCTYNVALHLSGWVFEVNKRFIWCSYLGEAKFSVYEPQWPIWAVAGLSGWDSLIPPGRDTNPSCGSEILPVTAPTGAIIINERRGRDELATFNLGNFYGGSEEFLLRTEAQFLDTGCIHWQIPQPI